MSGVLKWYPFSRYALADTHFLNFSLTKLEQLFLFRHEVSWNSSLMMAHFVQALKALILERMGKPDEALSACLNAKELLYSDDSALMDDLTLSTLQIAFERLNHRKCTDVSEMYSFCSCPLGWHLITSCSYQWIWQLTAMSMPVGNSQTIWTLWWGSSIAMSGSTLLWGNNRLAFYPIFSASNLQFPVTLHNVSWMCEVPLFIPSILFWPRQPLRCIKSLGKRDFCSGQFVASNCR